MENVKITYGYSEGCEIPLLDTLTIDIVKSTEGYLDQMSLVVNGTTVILEDIHDQLVFDRLQLCGCGVPEEMRQFWIDQITSIVEGDRKDYLGFAGGLEFFKRLAIKQGVLDDDENLTNLGKLTLEIMKIYRKVVEDNLSYDGDSDFVTPLPVYKVTQGDAYGDFDQRIDWFLLKLITPIAFRRRMTIKGADFDEMATDRYDSDFFKLETGAYYWLYHAIEAYGWGNHGGSAPGYLTPEGYDKYLELVSKFGVAEVDIFDLVEKNYQYGKGPLAPLSNEFKTIRPDLNWDFVFSGSEIFY